MTIEDRDNLGFMDGQVVFGMRLQSIAKASLGNGVLSNLVANTKLKITEDEGAAEMSVTAQLGNCIIDGTLYEEAADVEDIAIAAQHATNERIDLVFYDQSGSTVAVVTGTPHATDPQVPDCPTDLDIPLALVYVSPTDDEGGTIVDADIYDVRSFVVSEMIATDDLILLRKDTIRLLDNDASLYGLSTCWRRMSISYVYNTIFKMGSPPSAPNGYTVVSKFGCVLGTDGGLGDTDTVFAELYNATDATQICELTKEPTGTLPADYPEIKESGEITLIVGNAYRIAMKTEDRGGEMLSAWISYYAKKI